MQKNDEDNSPLSDTDAPTRTCYPTQLIEAAAKLGDEVCGLYSGEATHSRKRVSLIARFNEQE